MFIYVQLSLMNKIMNQRMSVDKIISLSLIIILVKINIIQLTNTYKSTGR